jgi:DNA modification methylase
MNTIFNESNLETLKRLSDCSLDLTVTSPPYDNLRKYNGYCFDFDNLCKELFRATKQGGVVVWNVSDAMIDGSETGTSLKQALKFMEVGFNLHDTMIWIKDGGGAIGSPFAYTQNFEYMFVFSKGRPKTTNLLRDKPNQSFGKDKSGVGRRKKDGEHKIETRKISSEFSKRNNYWYYPPEKGGEHPAVFPLQLAVDHIKSWSNIGDLVYDCFSGSGTTCVAAKMWGRQYLGSEISEQYFNLSQKRISETEQKSFIIEEEI